MDLYRKFDFLCEVCIKLYYDRKCREMLGIQKIVSTEEYNATNKLYCDKCELYGWDHNISEIGWYNRKVHSDVKLSLKAFGNP